MNTTELLAPILENGIRNTNFFNGRLLSAEDLRTEQAANRLQHGQLGRVIGDGVAFGLEVSKSTTTSPSLPGTTSVVRVTAGMAINRKGQALELTADADVALIREKEKVAEEAGFFAVCEPPTTAVPTGTGVYVLVISPASGFEGKAPMGGLGGNGSGAGGCGRRYAVEGVQFRLVEIKINTMTNVSQATRDEISALMTATSNLGTTEPDPSKLSMLRNRLAHLCFGTEELMNFPSDPFQRVKGESPYTTYGAMDFLLSQKSLTDCDVPLSLVYWTTDGIQFIDTWSVRRRPIPRFLSETWPLPVSERRLAEAVAVLLQFQDQMESILSFSSPHTLSLLKAGDYFRYVPPCGFLPVMGSGSPSGYVTERFFSALFGDVITNIDGDKLCKLVYESLFYRPIDLTSPVMVQIYQVKENKKAVENSESSQRYVAFTSRELHGILEDDAVARAFNDAWSSYRGLIKNRVFLPVDATSDAIGAQIAIIAAVRDVMDVALLKAALARGRHLNYADAVGAFSDLYRVQHELVILFKSPIPGITDTQGRENFADTINVYLESAASGGLLGLNPSITNNDLLGAVRAQNAINNFVGTWTGEGIAIGNIKVAYNSSPDGVNLVPNDPNPYKHAFTVFNKTDKTLTIQLNGSITAPHGDWTNVVRMKTTDGKIITDVTLVSAASQDVMAEITKVPGGTNGAQIGDVVTLTVTAAASPPQRQGDSANVTLYVASSRSGAVTRNVSFTGGALPGNAGNAPPSSSLGYQFTVLYTTSAPPLGYDFVFTVSLTPTAGALTGWSVTFPGQPTNNSVAGTYSASVHLDSGAERAIQFQVNTPARGTTDKRVSLAIEIESNDSPPISARLGPYYVTVQHS